MPITAMIVALLAAAAAQFQAPMPTSAPSQSEPPAASPSGADIVVEHRTRGALDHLVEDMTSTTGDTQIPRWNTAICMRVLGLDPDHGRLIEDRLSAIAKTVKVSSLHQPCDPNIIVVATTEADKFTSTFVASHSALLGDPSDGSPGAAVTQGFEASRPVRWRDATRLDNADGRPAGDGINNMYGGGSRILLTTRRNKIGMIVIVDMLQMSHIGWGQLADYVAFVALARPKMTAMPADSILSIFSARDAGTRGPTHLTGTDEALLQAIYRSNAAMDGSMQRSQIANRIAKGAKR